MVGQARDNQRSRLYDAEEVLAGLRVSRAAQRHLIDTQYVAGYHVLGPVLTDEDGNPLYAIAKGATEEGYSYEVKVEKRGPSTPMKCPTTKAVQAYMDAISSSAWFIRRWGVWNFHYVNGKGSHAGGWGNNVTVSQHHRRSEAVILHEMTHCLVRGGAPHGPEFAATLLTLVEGVMGKEHAKDLRASYAKHGVRYRSGLKAVPQPKSERWDRVKAAKR